MMRKTRNSGFLVTQGTKIWISVPDISVPVYPNLRRHGIDIIDPPPHIHSFFEGLKKKKLKIYFQQSPAPTHHLMTPLTGTSI